WLDEHLTHLIELTSCHVPGIGGCDDRSRDELRIGFDELAEDRKAVDVRHHQVEHQRVVAVLREHVECNASVRGGLNREATPCEQSFDQESNGFVVIDDKNTPGHSSNRLQNCGPDCKFNGVCRLHRR